LDGEKMNKKERISKLIFLAMSECESGKFDDVKNTLKLAVSKLTKIIEREQKNKELKDKELKDKELKDKKLKYANMNKNKFYKSLEEIEEMINQEEEKIKDKKPNVNLFG